MKSSDILACTTDKLCDLSGDFLDMDFSNIPLSYVEGKDWVLSKPYGKTGLIKAEPWDAGQGPNDLEKVIPVCPCFILKIIIILPSVFYILWQVC